MGVRDQLRKILKLGISGFETEDECRHLQTDLLERLERAGVEEPQFAALAQCGPTNCGRKRCSDACAFGARRRRLREILAVRRLLKKTGGPVYEVWFTRPVWERSSAKLRSISIPAVKKLNTRTLDAAFCPGAVAVGTVVASSHFQEPAWTVEVHELIAGADKPELDRAFANIAYVKQLKAKDVDQAISEVLKRDLDVSDLPPKAKRRAEFYQWTLNMPIDARVIRYGCDRQFNKLHKKPRVLRPKVCKKRPYPVWLKPHMFGGPKWANVAPRSGTYEPKKKGGRVNTSRDDGYYTRGDV